MDLEMSDRQEFRNMSSENGVGLGDFPMDLDSHQVFDNLDNLEIGNMGARASLGDLFGYSKEFERQLRLEIRPDDDFRITSFPYGSEYDFDSLQLMEHNNQNVNIFHDQNFVSSQESYVTMQEFAPAADQVHQPGGELVEKQVTIDPLPPAAAIETVDGASYFQWSSELHAGFMGAVQQLGGFERASPQHILYLMNVSGLNLDRVKTHLQAYQQDKYFGQESTKVSEIARSAFVAQQKGPSNSKAANKRLKRKPKAKKGSLDLKAQCEAQIDRFQDATNHYMDGLLQRAGQTIGNFGQSEQCKSCASCSLT